MPNAKAMALLEGDWVTSFSGYQILRPRPVPDPDKSYGEFLDDVATLPPLMGAYQWFPPAPFSFWPLSLGRRERFELREGYVLVTALIRLTLLPDGVVKGRMQFVREQPPGSPPRKLEGTYSIDEDVAYPESGHYVGTLSETHETSGAPTTFNYDLVVRTPEEIEYQQLSSNYRPVLARGTLRKVNFTP